MGACCAANRPVVEGAAADFGIDIEQDLIKSVTGKTKDERFGKIITGKDSLNLSSGVNLSNIGEFLKLCYEKFESNSYKKDFAWIDQISELKDPKIIDNLNNKLIGRIKTSNFDKAWMAVPDLIDWADVSGFSYKNKKENLNEDISLPDFLSVLPNDRKANLSLREFKRQVYCFGASSDAVFKCLYCEIQDDAKHKTYILSNAKWYEIESNFANQVNSDYKKLRDVPPAVALPVFKSKNENEYNESVAKSNGNFCCLDKNLIVHGGGYGKIEFCDLYTKDKKIIHVKRYGGSSVLSHLFSQGIVSGELFIADSEFRKKINDKLPADRKISNPEAKLVSSDFEIVFAVISSHSDKLDIPFFSKVNLRNAKRRLETFGYKVSFQKVEAK